MVPGIASVTFRDKTPWEVVDLALQAGLQSIEWGGDVHVPAGQLKRAATIGRLSRASGLQVSAYGSYYTVGKSRDEGLRFRDILETAQVLQAPIIRIWAGACGSRSASRAYRKKVLDESRGIADEAGKAGISLAFEFHDNTLNDNYAACCELLTQLAHPQLRTYWQPLHGAGPDINCTGIYLILPWIVGVHVFHWWPKAEMRLSLRDGASDWRQYIRQLSESSTTLPYHLEFVKDNSPEQFLKDAGTLLQLLGDHQDKSHKS